MDGKLDCQFAHHLAMVILLACIAVEDGGVVGSHKMISKSFIESNNIVSIYGLPHTSTTNLNAVLCIILGACNDL